MPGDREGHTIYVLRPDGVEDVWGPARNAGGFLSKESTYYYELRHNGDLDILLRSPEAVQSLSQGKVMATYPRLGWVRVYGHGPHKPHDNASRRAQLERWRLGSAEPS